MTREEAIYLLKQIYTGNPNDKDALNMAIEALERKRGEWIQHVNEPSLWSCSICETVIYSEHEEDRLLFHKWLTIVRIAVRICEKGEKMTNEEAIKYLIEPVATSTEPSEEYKKQKEAYDMAIESELHLHLLYMHQV